MKIFELMNKDRVIALVKCNVGSFQLRKYDRSLIDLNKEIDRFFNERLNPVLGRKNIELLLKEADIHGYEEFFEVSKALSFNDTLWLRVRGDKITWDKVNPYKNSLSKIVSQIALEGNYKAGTRDLFKSPSPEYETGGSFSKCWKRINGNIYMIKGGESKYNSISGNSSYNEYFACQIAEALGIKYYIDYSLMEKVDERGKRAFTRCKLFTDENIGYMSIGDSKYRDCNIDSTYNIMNNLGRGKEFREMLLLDSLIYNIDRHRGNYGFLIDNSNYKIIDMAPIFDNNLAFLSKVSLKDDEEEIERQIRIQRPYTMREFTLAEGSFIQQGIKAVRGSDDLKHRLKGLIGFKLNRTGIKYLEQERMDFMDKLINHQITSILKGC